MPAIWEERYGPTAPCRFSIPDPIGGRPTPDQELSVPAQVELAPRQPQAPELMDQR